MKIDTPSIGQLFSLSRDPVVCERNGLIVSMNPSAVTLFGSDLTRHLISEIVPETVLSVREYPFIASAVIEGKTATISCTSFADLRLFSFIIPDLGEEKPVQLPFSVYIRELANTIKVTSGQIMHQSERYHDEKMDRYAAIMLHNSSKLKRLVSNYSLLTSCMSNPQPFQRITVSVNQICAAVVEAVFDLAQAHGIKLEFVPETEVLASVDPELCRVMLLNLLSNSLINTPSGGKIQLILRANTTQFSITVADNGNGIPPEELSGIFSRYNKPVVLDSGQISAGLGLAVAEQIARLHNGTIIIQSAPGKGSTIAARFTRKSDTTLMVPWSGYGTTLTDSVMTELSTWLTWKDYSRDSAD